MSDERRDLAQRISGHLDDLDDATVKELVDGALKAERTVWVTVACKHCARDGKYEVPVPDAGQKVKALEILLRAREKPAEVPQQNEEGPGTGPTLEELAVMMFAYAPPSLTVMEKALALATASAGHQREASALRAYLDELYPERRPRRDGTPTPLESDAYPGATPPQEEEPPVRRAVGPVDALGISASNGNPHG